MAEDWVKKFLKEGVISEDQLAEADQIARRKGISPGDALVKLGYLDASDVASAQASQYGSQMVDLSDMEIPPAALELVAESLARENSIIPIAVNDGRVTVAFHDPTRLDIEEKLRFILAKEIDIVVAPKDQIEAAINRSYGQNQTESVDSMLAEFTETQIDFSATEVKQATAESVAEEDENSPVVKLCNLIISEAVKMRASDIHVEPFEDRVRIRYRIDGKLIERDKAPRRLLAAMTSRFKIMDRRTVASRRRSTARTTTFASASCRRTTGRASAYGFSIAITSRSVSAISGSAKRTIGPSRTSFAVRTGFFSSPARPVPEKRRRSTRRLANSIGPTRKLSRQRTPLSTTCQGSTSAK